MKHFKQLMVLGSLVCIIAMGLPSTALAITYDVNRVIGPGGVTGTIETDGTVGTLNIGNIVNWNLVLDDGIGTFNLLGPLSGNNSERLVQGSAFTASASNLFFDFSALESAVLFQNPTIGSSGPAWCLIGGGIANCAGFNNSDVLLVSGAAIATPFSGVQVIGSASAPVPEPSTMLLLGTGLAGLVAWRKKKSLA